MSKYQLKPHYDKNTVRKEPDHWYKPVVISVCIAPADISSEMHEITSLTQQYLIVDEGGPVLWYKCSKKQFEFVHQFMYYGEWKMRWIGRKEVISGR
ncbi:MAG: hypothetical protein GY845_29095 [Planctomycetes bacterium]|nr:hypothetical protein [Planctomycetota bacterium]